MGIGDDVRGLTFGQQLARLRPSQFVSEADRSRPDMFQARAHDDFVIIVHGSLVAAAGIDDRDEAAVFALHIFIAEAELAQKFRPAHFKPDEMIGVIDDAHLIGLGVAHADASFIHRRCRRLVAIGRSIDAGGRLIGPSILVCAFRGTTAMPSRKSALSRMPAFSRTAASICASSSARA